MFDVERESSSLICELNRITNGKNDLTNLGLFLSREVNVSALKLLNWLNFVIHDGLLEKNIKWNLCDSKKVFNGHKYIVKKENIPYRLLDNPLYISKEVFENIVKTNYIDFNFKSEYYLLKELMVQSILDFQNPLSKMYKMKEHVQKIVDVLYYLVFQGVIDLNSTMLYSLDRALESDLSMEWETIIRMIQSCKNTENNENNYNEVIKENLEIERHLLLTQKECEYFYNVVVPKLERKNKNIK